MFLFQQGQEDLLKTMKRAVVLEVHWQMPQDLVYAQQLELERQRYKISSLQQIINHKAGWQCQL